jgi:hypothetical protein
MDQFELLDAIQDAVDQADYANHPAYLAARQRVDALLSELRALLESDADYAESRG